MPEYDGCDYTAEDPLNTEPINHNVQHFIAGASIHCRQLMDHALSRLEEAREVVREVSGTLRQVQLDGFQQGLLRAHQSMWNHPDQWRLLALRIVMGKLMAVAFPILLRNHRWAGTYQPLWDDDNMHEVAVADHIWLHTAGWCDHEDVITRDFRCRQVMWMKYRPDGWTLEDDLKTPEEQRADSAPAAAAQPHHAAKKKKSKAIPKLRPDGTVDTSQAAPRGGPRGRGRGGSSTGIVQPGAPVHSGKGKGKEKAEETKETIKQTTEEVTAETTAEAATDATDEAGPSSAAQKAAGAEQTRGTAPPRYVGPYPVEALNPNFHAAGPMRDQPLPFGFRPGLPVAPVIAAGARPQTAGGPVWGWHHTYQPFGAPPRPTPPDWVSPPVPSFPSPSVPGSPPSVSGRPTSSGHLSATAEPFLPGGRAGTTEASQSESSAPGLDSPTRRRMADLYITDDE